MEPTGRLNRGWLFDPGARGYGVETESSSCVASQGAPFPANQRVPESAGGCEVRWNRGLMSLLTRLTDPAFEGSLHVRAAVGEVSTWVVVSGEADVADVPGLDDALERVPVDATPLVHLDLSELTFADSRAVRRLADFAVRARGAGRDVRTSGASQLVRRVATVLGVQDELGLA